MDEDSEDPLTLTARCLSVVVHNLDSIRFFPPHFPVSLLRKVLAQGLKYRKVTDANLPMFLSQHSQWVDLSNSLHLTDASLHFCRETCGPSLTHVSLYRAASFSRNALVDFFKSTPHLASVNLSRCEAVDDSVIETLCSSCPLLQDLDLTRATCLSRTSLQPLSRLTHLQRLVLFGCGAAVSDSILSSLHLPHLLHLSLARCSSSQLSDQGILSVCRHSPALQDLVLCGCRTLTDSLLQNEVFTSEHRLRLRYIDVSMCKKFSTFSLKTLFQQQPDLQVVYMSFTANVTDDVVETLASSCCDLRKVYLSRQPDLSSECITHLVERCTRLETLNLSSGIRLTDETLTAVARNLPHLDTLYVGGNRELTDRSMQELCCNRQLNPRKLFNLESSYCPRMVTEPSVRTIADSGWGRYVVAFDFTGCEVLSDACMLPLAESCLCLRFLSVSKTCVSDVGVQHLANPKYAGAKMLDLLNLTQTLVTERTFELVGSFPLLTKLYLASCPNVGLKEVSGKIQFQAPKLEALFLSYCQSLTDQTLLRLMDHAPQLSCIMLTQCVRLTDVSLAQIAKKCPNIAMLDLSGVRHVTDTTLLRLAENCRFLATLILSECFDITSAGVTMLLNLLRLRTLVVSFCPRVSDEILRHIDSQHTLLSIALTGTQVTQGAVREWKEAHPDARLRISLKGSAKQQQQNFAEDEENDE